MDEHAWTEKLKKKGFQNVRSVGCIPEQDFPEHTHDQQTVHVILKGEITLIETGNALTLKEGDYFEIPAGTTHTAKAGPKGCTFLVGWK